jgi:hypothetical protein
MTKVHYGSLLQVLIVNPGRRCGYAGGLLELIVGVRANDGRSSEELVAPNGLRDLRQDAAGQGAVVVFCTRGCQRN